MNVDELLSTDSFKDFENGIKELSDQELKVFVPKVYQKNIYLIDYDLLAKKGVKLITYDIDRLLTG